MPGHSLDNRVPTFIQFTDTNRRTSKRRSARLQQGNQPANKKRKTDTPPKKRRIPLEEKNTDHQHMNASCNTKADDTSDMDHLEQINQVAGIDKVTTKMTPEQQPPVSPIQEMNTNDPMKRMSTESSPHDDSFEHTSPEPNHDKNTDDSYEHISPEPNHDKNTDDSYEHISPEPNHDKNTDDSYEHTSPESNHDQLFEQISPEPNHDPCSIARQLEFNTITLSPDHDRKKLAPPSPKNSPQVITPTESPIPEHTSNTPSPTTEIRLTPSPPFEPSEFYTPMLDTPQPADEWTMTRHIKGFFGRIKTGWW